MMQLVFKLPHPRLTYNKKNLQLKKTLNWSPTFYHSDRAISESQLRREIISEKFGSVYTQGLKAI